MAELIVLGLAALWFMLALKLGRWASRFFRNPIFSKSVGAIAFLAVFLLPFTDEFLGDRQFQKLCDTEAVTWISPNASAVTAAAHGKGSFSDLKGYIIPISKQKSEYIDLATGEPFFRRTAFHTPGGFIKRAGLNMGNSKSCWPKNNDAYKNLKIDDLLKRGKNKSPSH